MRKENERLLTADFLLVSGGNFFLFLSFYALMPLLPFYLAERFGVGDSVIGMILACFMVPCILIRPFVGHLLDRYSRRPVYLVSYYLFALAFLGYAGASTLMLFVVMRVVHGGAFGSSTVSGSTLVSQIVPKNRIGEGLGYYGVANTVAMSLGPLLGLLFMKRFPFEMLFAGIFVLGLLGAVCASFVRMPTAAQNRAARLSPKSMFLPNGWIPFVVAMFVSTPYGATTSYIAVYAEELGIGSVAGIYFTLMAAGNLLTRPFIGRKVDHGWLIASLAGGIVLTIVVFFGLGFLSACGDEARQTLFLAFGFAQGLAYGTLQPSFNTLFVRLAPAERRGVATSMYFTGSDTGIGIGVLSAGIVAQYFSGYSVFFLAGGALCTAALLTFTAWRIHTRKIYQL